MKKYVENKVTELVDERLKTMMPIIKNQLSNEVVPTMLAKNPVHIGTTCNSCSGSLVTGIIYKCPTCTKFYLCEKCE